MIAILCGLALLTLSASGEEQTWDCPECGRTGNTGNYCGGCAHPDNNNRSAHFNTFTHAKTNLYTNSHTKASEHIAPPIKT